jgi:hypothetical protein
MSLASLNHRFQNLDDKLSKILIVHLTVAITIILHVIFENSLIIII